MGAAIAHRHAKALAVANDHVGTKFARSAQQDQCQQIGGHDDQGVVFVGFGNEGFVVEDVAIGVGILHQHAKGGGAKVIAVMVAHDDVNAQRFGAGLHHGNGLRMALLGNEEGVGFGFARLVALAQGHRFGSGCAFVQQGGVGNFQAGQVADHGLEVEQGFQPPLGNFWLVGGVLRCTSRGFRRCCAGRRGAWCSRSSPCR